MNRTSRKAAQRIRAPEYVGASVMSSPCRSQIAQEALFYLLISIDFGRVDVASESLRFGDKRRISRQFLQ
jgi:hypothetical protein